MKTRRQNPGIGILIFLMLNVGGISNIQAQNGWERMPDMPTSRAVFKTVLHEGKIYAIGGLKSVHPPYGITTEVYDTETGEWTMMASMENPCSGLSVEIVNNKIYVIGGVYSTEQQYTVIQEYDIQTNTWSTKCNMPEPRFNHVSEVIDGKIYIAGGLSVDENGNHPGLLSSLVYDPVNDLWDTIADLHYERFFGRSCVFNNKIYVFGGAPSGVPYSAAHQSIEIYDPETDVWILSEDEIPVPFMGGMVQVYGDSILLSGGFRVVLDKENYNCIYKYVPGTQHDKWHKMASMPVKRGVMAGNIVDHYLHMIGGFDGFQNNDLEISQDNHWRLDLDSLKEHVFIPDTAFLYALIDEGVDINGDSLISYSEAEAVNSLNVEGGASEKKISDLSGIEAFIYLDTLNCNRNQLSSLDVSSCTRLKYLECGDTYVYFSKANLLSSLDLANNTELTYLNCSGNYLNSLDLSNNTEIKYLGCALNEITSLDLTNNTKLELLYTGSNQLASLDLSNNSALETLACEYNLLSSLYLPTNSSLLTLKCSGNDLSSLDLSNSSSLMHLVCSENQFSSLNLAECIVLAKLQCDNNNLSSLNLANCIALSELNCSDNSLDSLDISNNTALTYIRLNGMPTLFKVCVWTTPFPPDSISFSSNRSPNVYFTTKCSDYISPDITAVDSLLPDYIEATSSKDGMIYLVDEETDKDIVAIQEACIDSVEALANTPVIISLSGMNNGVYWLYASDTAGNISEPEAFTIIVGIDQTRDNSYRIYPNPTKNYVTIETEQPDYRSIDITSLNGQLIYNISMEGTSQQIDLSTFNKGVYIITIRSKNNVTTEKIIIL